MTDLNSDRTTETISIPLLLQAKGHYGCHLSSSLSDSSYQITAPSQRFLSLQNIR